MNIKLPNCYETMQKVKKGNISSDLPLFMPQNCNLINQFVKNPKSQIIFAPRLTLLTHIKLTNSTPISNLFSAGTEQSDSVNKNLKTNK